MIANNTIACLPDCYVPANADRNQFNDQAAESKSSIARLRIEDLVTRIEKPPVRAIVDSVFQDLLRLLECLDLIQSHVRQVEKAGETLTLFHLIHSEAQALISSVKAEALAAEQIDGVLAETLDGISFAVEHDLKRVFDSSHESLSSDDRQHLLIGKLVRSYDLLTNCLQQSTVTLAAVFDSSFLDFKLFNDTDERLRESLQLCADLSELLRCVEHAERNVDDDIYTRLLLALNRFQSDSLQYLMYSDWPEFEGFCNRIESSSTNRPNVPALLHQFHCYLETLMGQVKMRAVFAESSGLMGSCALESGFLSGTVNASDSGRPYLIDFDNGRARAFETTGISSYDVAIAALA